MGFHYISTKQQFGQFFFSFLRLNFDKLFSISLQKLGVPINPIDSGTCSIRTGCGMHRNKYSHFKANEIKKWKPMNDKHHILIIIHLLAVSAHRCPPYNYFTNFCNLIFMQYKHFPLSCWSDESKWFNHQDKQTKWKGKNRRNREQLSSNYQLFTFFIYL